MNWRGIIVHHTAGPDIPEVQVDDIRSWHVDGRGWRDIGYHFVVEMLDDGNFHAIQGRPLTMTGAHARGYNSSHIGVALVGDFTTESPPVAQLREAARLIAGLIRLGGLEHGILFHRDVATTSCPGDKLYNSGLREMVLDLI